MIDLSKAKVGDKVKHRNGGVSVIKEIGNVTKYIIWIDGVPFYKNGAYVDEYDTPIDIVELLPAEDELEKAADNLAIAIKGGWNHESIKVELLNFAKAIKESR